MHVLSQMARQLLGVRKVIGFIQGSIDAKSKVVSGQGEASESAAWAVHEAHDMRGDDAESVRTEKGMGHPITCSAWNAQDRNA